MVNIKWVLKKNLVCSNIPGFIRTTMSLSEDKVYSFQRNIVRNLNSLNTMVCVSTVDLRSHEQILEQHIYLFYSEKGSLLANALK